jgi:hypothetical protein
MKSVITHLHFEERGLTHRTIAKNDDLNLLLRHSFCYILRNWLKL